MVCRCSAGLLQIVIGQGLCPEVLVYASLQAIHMVREVFRIISYPSLASVLLHSPCAVTFVCKGACA